MKEERKKKNSENLMYDILNLRIQINSFRTPLTTFYQEFSEYAHTQNDISVDDETIALSA